MSGGRGGLPSPFSGGSKGGILFGKRILPLSGSSAKSCTNSCSAARCTPPREGGIKRGNLFGKRIPPLSGSSAKSCTNSCSADGAATSHPPRRGESKGATSSKREYPFVWQQRNELHELMQRLRRCNLPSPREGGNQKGQPLRKEYPPLSGSSAKSCTNSCSADGAATTHPPQGRLKRDTLFRKKVSPFIFPFPRSAEISVPAPVQDYFLKLSFSVTDRLNTRCSGVQSLLSRQK